MMKLGEFRPYWLGREAVGNPLSLEGMMILTGPNTRLALALAVTLTLNFSHNTAVNRQWREVCVQWDFWPTVASWRLLTELSFPIWMASSCGAPRTMPPQRASLHLR